MPQEPQSASVLDTPRSARGSATVSFSGDGSQGVADGGAVPESLVGQQLGQFRVEARIGQGGLGVVYRAYDVKLKRPVALKVLAHGHAQIDRLLAEARSAAALAHASIAAIYDVQQVAGIAFLVMELVPGRTLREELSRGRLTADRALSVATDISAAIARAHQVGIVHRDLKPENVMITPDGAAKILDFGLARDVAGYESEIVEAGDATGAAAGVTGVVGTRHYMSPEQAAGRVADPRTDVFSFGVVLHEMLAGRRPFESRAEADPRKWERGAFVAANRVRSLSRQAPRALERIVERCLEIDPQRRFANGGEVAAALVKVRRTRARFVPVVLGLTLAGACVAAYDFVHHARTTPPVVTTSAASHPGTHRQTFDAAGQTWEVVDGEWLRDGADLVGRSGHIETTVDVADAVIDLDVDFPKGPTATIGIGFRYSLTGDNPRAQCGYGINFRAGPEVATFLGEDGDWGALGQGYQGSSALRDGKNHFTIRMAGASFVVEANGQRIDAFTNARWPAGRVNLWVARTETRFSNVRITPTH